MRTEGTLRQRQVRREFKLPSVLGVVGPARGLRHPLREPALHFSISETWNNQEPIISTYADGISHGVNY